MNNLFATFTNHKSSTEGTALQNLISREIEVNDIFEINEVIDKVIKIAEELREKVPKAILDVVVVKLDGTIILDGSIKDGFEGKVYPIYETSL